MELEIITIYCLCDDFLISVNHQDDPQVRMNTAEIMTTALTAAAFFPATMKKAEVFSRNTIIGGGLNPLIVNQVLSEYRPFSK